MVDLYRYRKDNPDRTPPSLLYWGQYVAHDNNRDGLGLALKQSQNVLKAALEWHPQVIHDLHESVPFLYTSTGTGPYNAWLDPIVIDEWHLLAYHEIEELTKRGVPGVWTHGFYDGWAPNYMFYAANGHNAIGRFYETFGNGGADTKDRTVRGQSERARFRPNPPLPRVKWSIRNNINLQQSALMLALKFVADNKERFLDNFYRKSRRSIEKPQREGPAAYVVAGDEPRAAGISDLLAALQIQGIEAHRTTGAVKVKETAKDDKGKDVEKEVSLPAGSYVVRMDQPQPPGRHAPRHPVVQRDLIRGPTTTPGDAGSAPRRQDRARDRRLHPQGADDEAGRGLAGPGSVSGSGGVLVVDNRGESCGRDAALPAEGRVVRGGGGGLRGGREEVRPRRSHRHCWRRRPRGGRVGGQGPLAVGGGGGRGAEGQDPQAEPSPHRPRPRLAQHAERGLVADRVRPLRRALRLRVRPRRARHRRPARPLGRHHLPPDRHRVPPAADRRHPDRRRGPADAEREDPNLGGPDKTDDMRGGLGFEGLANLRRFVEGGGALVAAASSTLLPVRTGMVEAVDVVEARGLQARGSVLRASIVDKGSPIAYGYGDTLAVYFNQAPVFDAGPAVALGGAARFAEIFGPPTQGRVSGRGGPKDPDIPQGRSYVAPAEAPKGPPQTIADIPEEILDFVRNQLPPEDRLPRIVARFAKKDDLWVPGMLDKGEEPAEKPAVIDCPVGRGHVVLFANNPMWRWQTHGSHALVFNTVPNWDHLDAGRAPAAKAAAPEKP
jgi:hypothetical protein